MNKRNCAVGRAVTSGLALLLLLGGAVLADGAGTQSDPLITMSYLNQTVIPSVLAQIDDRTETYRQQLVDALDSAVKEYSEKMDAALADQQKQSVSSAAYKVVTLSRGQQMKLDIGCEVMLRIGTAQCVSPSAPGLIDVTTGSTVNDGTALSVNHLCMATISGRSIRATAATVKILTRGSYTIA